MRIDQTKDANKFCLLKKKKGGGKPGIQKVRRKERENKGIGDAGSTADFRML